MSHSPLSLVRGSSNGSGALYLQLSRLILHRAIFMVSVGLDHAATEFVDDLSILGAIVDFAADAGVFAMGNQSRHGLERTEALGASKSG